MSAMIDYGVTHCPHCEKPYAPEEARTVGGLDYGRYCYGTGATHVEPTCDLLESGERDAHLIAVLQERDVLRAELAQVHAGQLALLVGVA